MKFPSIKRVAGELRWQNERIEDTHGDGIDVRLQVYPDAQWALRYGLCDYDPDHLGYWGASSIPCGNKRFNSREVARDLIEQCREQYALEQSAPFRRSTP